MEKWEEEQFGNLSEGAQWLGNLQQGISNGKEESFNWAMSTIYSDSKQHDLFREAVGQQDSTRDLSFLGGHFSDIAGDDELRTGVGKLIGSISGEEDFNRYKEWFNELDTYNQSISKTKRDISLGIIKYPSSVTGVTSNMKKFLMDNSSVQTYKNKLDNINRMKSVYLDGIDRAAAKQAYIGRQNIINAQRKFGLTGAVAERMIQDFELKHSEMHVDARNKAMLEFEKQYGASRMRLESEQELGRAAAINAVKHQAQTGKYTPKKMRETLVGQGINVDGLTDEDLNSFIMNPNSI